MRKIAVSLICLLAALLPLAAQSNSYEIDDECYSFFQQAEVSVGDLKSDAFERANDKLLELAQAKGDDKAITLHYVETLKRMTARGRVAPELERRRHNEAVEQARLDLQNVAKQLGYPQYYYNAFELSQTYYYDTRQPQRAFDLLNEMIVEAHNAGDEYGMWQANRFLSMLYQNQGDLLNTRRCLQRGLDIYEHSKDPTIRRQSVTRMYCDLADTYDIDTDSARIYYRRAWDSAQVELDTLRCTFYDALQASYNKYGKKIYEEKRDYCMAHPSFQSIISGGPTCFRIIDGILGGQEPTTAQLDSISDRKQRHFLGRLAYQNNMPDPAYYLSTREISSSLNNISDANDSRLQEANSQWEKFRMTADLAAKSLEIARITRLVSVLVAIILLGGLIFSLIHIHNLRKSNARDLERIEELKEANERVRLADAAKTRFVQNMSHEVRTPLNAIVGFSQLLSLPDGTFSEQEKAEFSEYIVNNTKMLTMLLDDILNASAMDTGHYKITYEDGECHFICQSAITSAEHRLQPGVRMYYAPESEEPFHFRTDARRVQQILINLLTNACKHTTQGEIKLTSSLTEHPGEVTFAVTDTGPGVPAEDAERIFDRFTKLNDFVQGTGLGLSICRDIAGRMGARVYLDTTYTAGGARFVFVVPVHPDEHEAPEPPRTETKPHTI